MANFSHATISITPYLVGVSNYISANCHNTTTRQRFRKRQKNTSENCRHRSHFLMYMPWFWNLIHSSSFHLIDPASDSRMIISSQIRSVIKTDDLFYPLQNVVWRGCPQAWCKTSSFKSSGSKCGKILLNTNENLLYGQSVELTKLKFRISLRSKSEICIPSSFALLRLLYCYKLNYTARSISYGTLNTVYR